MAQVKTDESVVEFAQYALGMFLLATTTADDCTPKSLAESASVTPSDIERLAYDLYVARGCEHGHDIEDWLQAERALRSF